MKPPREYTAEKKAGPRGPAWIKSSRARSELQRYVREQEPPERVIDVRVGIAVDECRREVPDGHERRILVEHVVDADAEADVLVEHVGGVEVEVRITPNRVRRSPLPVEQRVGAIDVLGDLADVPPRQAGRKTRERRLVLDHELVLPLRRGRAAGGAEITRAVVPREAELTTGLGDELRGVRSIETEVHSPGRSQIEPIAAGQIDTPRFQGAEVQRGIVDVARRRDPKATEHIAMDVRAEVRVAGVETLRQLQRESVRGDDVLDPDTEVVQLHAEIWNGPRRQDDTERRSVRRLRLQLRVAPDQSLVLTGRIRDESPVLRSRHARPHALSQGGRGRSGRRAGARVERALQGEHLLREQLLQVRSTHRAVIAGAQAYVGCRRPGETELVRVGVESDGIGGVAIADLRGQLLRERLVRDERHA